MLQAFRLYGNLPANLCHSWLHHWRGTPLLIFVHVSAWVTPVSFMLSLLSVNLRKKLSATLLLRWQFWETYGITSYGSGVTSYSSIARRMPSADAWSVVFTISISNHLWTMLSTCAGFAVTESNSYCTGNVAFFNQNVCTFESRGLPLMLPNGVCMWMLMWSSWMWKLMKHFDAVWLI